MGTDICTNSLFDLFSVLLLLIPHVLQLSLSSFVFLVFWGGQRGSWWPWHYLIPLSIFGDLLCHQVDQYDTVCFKIPLLPSILCNHHFKGEAAIALPFPGAGGVSCNSQGLCLHLNCYLLTAEWCWKPGFLGVSGRKGTKSALLSSERRSPGSARSLSDVLV